MLERTKDIHIRATPEELEKIMKRMEESGITSLTAYLLRMALYGYVIVMDLSDLKEILRLLQISGNNLNQYAKKANETGSIYHEDIEELKNFNVVYISKGHEDTVYIKNSKVTRKVRYIQIFKK